MTPSLTPTVLHYDSTTLTATITSTLPPPNTPTPTLSATPTQLPTETLVPGPLSENGPWLLFFRPKPAVSNLDGSGFTELGIPFEENQVPHWLPAVVPSPHGGYISAVIKMGPADFEIWIMRLPQKMIVKKISLLGESAQQAIRTWDAGGDHPPFEAPVLATVKNIKIMQWSPDGRYLAFSGAMDGPSADIYVFDTTTGNVTRLSGGDEQAILMGWSPDSSWIVHASAKWIDDQYGPNLTNIWAVSVLDRQVKDLFEPVCGDEYILSWTSSRSFISYGRSPESPLNCLKEVLIEPVTVTKLYQAQFTDVDINSLTNIIYMIVSQYMFWKPEIPQGIYMLPGNSHDPVLIYQGKGLLYLFWHAELRQFSVYDEAKGKTFTFDPSGKIIVEIPGETFLYPSPDGLYILLRSSDAGNLQLYDVVNGTTTDLQEASDFAWLPDSSMFITINLNEQKIFQYSLANHWLPSEGIKVNAARSDYDVFQIVLH
jgi:hypothetical protein